MSIWARSAKRFFSFSGRMGRADFWTVIAALLAICAAAVVAPLRTEATMIIVSGCLWPYLAVSIKRLRDTGKSPKLIVIPFAASAAVWSAGMALFVFALFAAALLMVPQAFGALPAMAGVFLWLVVLPQIAFLIWIGLKRTQLVSEKAVAG